MAETKPVYISRSEYDRIVRYAYSGLPSDKPTIAWKWKTTLDRKATKIFESRRFPRNKLEAMAAQVRAHNKMAQRQSTKIPHPRTYQMQNKQSSKSKQYTGVITTYDNHSKNMEVIYYPSEQYTERATYHKSGKNTINDGSYDSKDIEVIYHPFEQYIQKGKITTCHKSGKNNNNDGSSYDNKNIEVSYHPSEQYTEREGVTTYHKSGKNITNDGSYDNKNIKVTYHPPEQYTQRDEITTYHDSDKNITNDGSYGSKNVRVHYHPAGQYTVKCKEKSIARYDKSGKNVKVFYHPSRQYAETGIATYKKTGKNLEVILHPVRNETELSTGDTYQIQNKQSSRSGQCVPSERVATYGRSSKNITNGSMIYYQRM